MSEFFQTLGHELANHAAAYGFGIVTLYAASVTSMPENPPQSFAEYWQWVRAALQSSLPIHRNPPPPEGPAQPKE